MPKKPAEGQMPLFEVEEYLKTAPCVPLLRQKVGVWREEGYPGATDVTKRLLAWWFANDHRLADGRPFAYHRAQRDAIETLIYAYEVARVRSRRELYERFARADEPFALPPDDDFARFATKMATGSGKTKVMSLAIAWQYFNAIMGGDGYARTFLIIAPNVIVLERLAEDFTGGRIFRTDPVMPLSMRYFWDMETVVRGDPERPDAGGLILLTNIQQLYDRPENGNGDEPEPLAAVLGPKAPPALSESASFIERIQKRDGSLMVLNDEAHHTHEEDNAWNTVIRALHETRPIAAQLDFSATPRFTKGGLFPWVISDYPLKQAIIDGVVKRPYKGVTDLDVVTSDIASVKYHGFIVAGVNRWREYREQLAPLGKRPLLFIMLTTNAEADDVGARLAELYPAEFGDGQTLVIHTDTKGEITKRELDTYRKAAREVDAPESKINALVSVLMLREGWDVQNVTVVVGLRPYSAKANILPEQTIGRGLRLMFRGENPGYTERVDIIGTSGFMQFVDNLEQLEQVELGEFEVGKDKLTILTIQPDPDKAAYDIAIPQLTPILTRKRSITAEIEALNVRAFLSPPFPKKPNDEAERTFHYEGLDFVTLEREFSRDYNLPTPQTANEVIGYYARLIASDLKLPSQFATLAPKVKEFFAVKAFGGPVDLDDHTIIQAMSRAPVAHVVRKLFTNALREKIVEEQIPELVDSGRSLAQVQPFPFSNPNVTPGHKLILNYAPCTNTFEKAFAQFLDAAPDITAWCKVPESFRFCIEYTDHTASLRYYYPDFVAVAADGTHWIIETKGAETVEVQHKDNAARIWCDNATQLTGVRWAYIKVAQKDFEKMEAKDFGDITLLGWT
ncbi:MAG TPA: DEAD/DEAH box helicase family protein [Ktedonobacterales bacterium]|nr:DEAD/DEAH box helicase family protein [Ktedonobacterales bacterium]